MSVGNHSTARGLYDYFERTTSFRAPRGFRNIGHGAYRTAFLENSTKTVYKVGDPVCNINEAFNSRRLRKKSTRNLGIEVYIPYTRTFAVGREDNIVAQEYAANSKRTYCDYSIIYGMDEPCSCKANVCFADVHERLLEWSDIGDIHEDNILVDNKGVFWMIDISE